MKTFAIIEKASGTEVHRYSNDIRVEWPGWEYATHDHIELVEEPLPPRLVEPRRMTKLQFVGLLAPEEFAELLVAAKTDVRVEVFIKMLDWTTPDPDGTSIDRDDPRTVEGVRALFSPERADQLLGVIHD